LFRETEPAKNVQIYCASWQAEGRYSFSLTTFDPTGKLGQFKRVMEAAVQGTPIVGLIVKMAARQLLPSP
jgi:hypothetical protein